MAYREIGKMKESLRKSFLIFHKIYKQVLIDEFLIGKIINKYIKIARVNL